jgi:methylisocitrate lyase
MANMVPGGKTPILSAKELEKLGFAIVAYPTLLTYTMARAAERALGHLRSNQTTAGFDDMMDFGEFNRLIGLDEVRAQESAWYGRIAPQG